MKPFPIFTMLMIVALACQDASNESLKESNFSTFNKSVGDRIDTELGLKWIDNFKKSNKRARSAEKYSVSKSNLKMILASTKDIMGIGFHYGLDEQGKRHIIVAPIDEHLPLWSGTIIDANDNTEIPSATAAQWIDKYKNSVDSHVWYHSFGTEIFEEIINYPDFEIVQALNDEQQPQLLLIVGVLSESSGRVNYTSNYFVYDASGVCPPACIK